METVEYRSASHEDMPRKFLDIRFSDHPTIAEKGQLRPFPAFRRGWVKGRVPCRYLGQRPKPSESYASFLSTVFKVHLSLIFLFSFFHNSIDTTSMQNTILFEDYTPIQYTRPVLKKSGFCGNITVEKNIEGINAPYVFLIFTYYQRSRLPYYKYHAMIFLDLHYVRS